MSQGNSLQTLQPTNHVRLREYVFLKIRQVSKNDSGMYICTATNKFGTTEETYTLKVIGKESLSDLFEIVAGFFTFKWTESQKILIILF